MGDAVVSGDAIPVDLVMKLISEMQGLRADFARHTATAPSSSGIAAAIAAEIGPNLFTASEIIRRAESRPGPLRIALAANLRQVNARALGKALARLQGKVSGGFSAVRMGEEAAGVIWRVVEMEVEP